MMNVPFLFTVQGPRSKFDLWRFGIGCFYELSTGGYGVWMSLDRRLTLPRDWVVEPVFGFLLN